MGSRGPTLRKSPSTLPHRRAFWGFRGRMGAVPTRIDGLGRAAFALLFCARASFCPVGGRIYDKRPRKHSGASETAGNGQRVVRNGARRCVFRRICWSAASHAAPELARWTQNTAAFSQIMGDFAEKQRCFWSALWSAEQNGRRAAEQVGAKGANLGQCGHNM